MAGLFLVWTKDGYHLKDAVVEGGVPFDKAHGVNEFEYPAKDNRFNKGFNKCMYDETIIVMKMILKKYKGFEGVKVLTDVGGGLGANLELIVSMYPDIKGINFDLPHVIKDAPPYPDSPASEHEVSLNVHLGYIVIPYFYIYAQMQRKQPAITP